MAGKSNGMIRTAFLLSVLLLASACGFPFGVYHTVEPGQTLYNIARVYNVPLEDIEQANNLHSTTDIKPGEKLFIPGAQKTMYVPPTVAVGGGSSVPAGSHNGNHPAPRGQSAPSPAAPHRPPAAGSVSFMWPLRGKILQEFERVNGIKHDGIDIQGPAGAPVFAAASGTVIYSNDTIRGYGNMIIIKHKDGFVSVYAHNSENMVRKGQYVHQGQMIARVGKTGYATAPHLHFEIRLHAMPVNPLDYLPR